MLSYEDNQWVWKINNCFCADLAAWSDFKEISAICEGEARLNKDTTTVMTNVTNETSTG